MTTDEKIKAYHDALQENRRNVGNYKREIEKRITWRHFSWLLLGLMAGSMLLALVLAIFKP